MGDPATTTIGCCVYEREAVILARQVAIDEPGAR